MSSDKAFIPITLPCEFGMVRMRIYKDGSIDHLGFHPAEFIEGAGEIIGDEKTGAYKPPAPGSRDNAEDESGECRSCAKKKKASFLQRMAAGVPGLLRAEMGIGMADQVTIEKRRATCLACPSGYYNFGVCDEERGGCGCYLAAKISVAKEKCPESHWEAVINDGN